MNINNNTKLEIIQADLFSGKFPPKPRHTCKKTGGLIGNDKGVRFIPFNQRAWRDRVHIKRGDFSGMFLDKCEACFYDHVYRIVKQIETEISNSPDDNWGYVSVTDKELTTLTRKYESRKRRDKVIGTKKKDNVIISRRKVKFYNFHYLGVPQDDNTILLFHNSPELTSSKIISVFRGKLWLSISAGVSAMPPRSRLRVSRGFGLAYAKTNGDSRAKQAHTIRLHTTTPSFMRQVLTQNGIVAKNNNYTAPIKTILKILDDNRVPYTISAGHDILGVPKT